jgi:hypothetical protein
MRHALAASLSGLAKCFQSVLMLCMKSCIALQSCGMIQFGQLEKLLMLLS